MKGENAMEKAYVIGIDIGGTNFRIGAVRLEHICMAEEDNLQKAFGSTANMYAGATQDADGMGEDVQTGRSGIGERVLALGAYRVYLSHFQKIPVREVFCSASVMEDLTQYLRRYCEMLRCEGKTAAAVSIGFPTTLDKNRRTVLQAPNIPFMENMPVVEALERALGIPVLIEKDVGMSLLYDKIKYGLDDCQWLCGIYFGTGIGNAIFADGRLLTGRNGTAGELGHIPVDGSVEKCGCGNEGCMENLAGGKYLARLCRGVYRQTEIGELFLKHADEPLLRQFVDRMAATVAVELNILDPDCLVLGGGILNMKAFPKAYLRERILFHTRKPYPAQNLRLIFAGDEREKAVVGAALFAAKSGRLPSTH